LYSSTYQIKIIDLIKDKNISCLTLTGLKVYPLFFPPLCDYSYENVKTVSISSFWIKQGDLSDLKANNGDCNMQLTDIHIIDDSMTVSDEFIIFRNVVFI